MIKALLALQILILLGLLNLGLQLTEMERSIKFLTQLQLLRPVGAER